MEILAFRFDTAGPDDIRELKSHLDRGTFKAEEVLCIVGKTEGNGGRNDFTRNLAMAAFEELFSARLGISKEAVQDRIIFSLSGGTEGVVTPHIVVFIKRNSTSSKKSGAKRLAIGLGFTRDFKPSEIGRKAQIEETARAVQQTLKEMNIADPKDVHLIQLKGAIPTFTPAEAAAQTLRCDMVYSRAASALGVALALGETNKEKVSDEMVCKDYSVYSSVASCSAKPGLARTEFMVFANSPEWGGELTIAHGVLQDMLDVHGIHQVLQQLQINLTVPPNPKEMNKIVAVFAKSEADTRGSIRGHRHTMLTDDDISDTRYSRCVLSSVIAATLGDPRVYVSTRAEHHGPQGGGNIAIIARATSGE